MRRPEVLLASLFAVAVTVACTTATAEEYYDTARVVSAEPVYVSRQLRPDECERGAPTHRSPSQVGAPLGDVRADDPGLGLGQVLRQAAARPARLVCELVTERRIVGYDVTMRYGGEQWVRRMSRDPGETVRVRVNLAPGAGSRRTRARMSSR